MYCGGDFRRPYSNSASCRSTSDSVRALFWGSSDDCRSLRTRTTLLMEDTEEIVDIDVLEKYLPSFKHLAVPFIVEIGTAMDLLSDGFFVTTRTADEIRQFIRSADRSLIF